MIVARGVASILSLIHFYVLVTNLSTKPVHLPEKLVIARGAESPTLKEQPRGPSKRTDGEGEVSAV